MSKFIVTIKIGNLNFQHWSALVFCPFLFFLQEMKNFKLVWENSFQISWAMHVPVPSQVPQHCKHFGFRPIFPCAGSKHFGPCPMVDFPGRWLANSSHLQAIEELQRPLGKGSRINPGMSRWI